VLKVTNEGVWSKIIQVCTCYYLIFNWFIQITEVQISNCFFVPSGYSPRIRISLREQELCWAVQEQWNWVHWSALIRHWKNGS